MARNILGTMHAALSRFVRHRALCFVSQFALLIAARFTHQRAPTPALCSDRRVRGFELATARLASAAATTTTATAITATITKVRVAAITTATAATALLARWARTNGARVFGWCRLFCHGLWQVAKWHLVVALLSWPLRHWSLRLLQRVRIAVGAWLRPLALAR